MPYFDGRESGMLDTEIKRIRDTFQSDVKEAQSYFTAQDVTVEDVGGGKGRIIVGSMENRHLYPRQPTEDLARELYLEDEITESEFECLIEHVLARESEAEFFTEV